MKKISQVLSHTSIFLVMTIRCLMRKQQLLGVFLAFDGVF